MDSKFIRRKKKKKQKNTEQIQRGTSEQWERTLKSPESEGEGKETENDDRRGHEYLEDSHK